MSAPRFLDPRVLARIGDLELLARRLVDGFVAGQHRSPRLGVSTDFAEHRPYLAGDDVRRIDWRLYGRTDRLYVKEFEAETNADVTVLLDVSASMGYGSGGDCSNVGESNGGGLTKLAYARILAACLAWFSHRQRDRVGLATFAADIVDQVPATGRRLDALFHTLARAEAADEGELERPLQRVANVLRRRGLVILISDFYDDPETVRRAIAQLGRRRGPGGQDILAFQVLDRREVDLDFPEPTIFEDLETGERRPVSPRSREADTARMAEHVAEIERVLSGAGADPCRLVTDQPLDHALHAYLSRRQRLKRIR